MTNQLRPRRKSHKAGAIFQVYRVCLKPACQLGRAIRGVSTPLFQPALRKSPGRLVRRPAHAVGHTQCDPDRPRSALCIRRRELTRPYIPPMTITPPLNAPHISSCVPPTPPDRPDAIRTHCGCKSPNMCSPTASSIASDQ
jgi:hypothetical protein